MAVSAEDAAAEVAQAASEVNAPDLVVTKSFTSPLPHFELVFHASLFLLTNEDHTTWADQKRVLKAKGMKPIVDEISGFDKDNI